MKDILDETFIQQEHLANRRILFFQEIKKYGLWVSFLLLYIFMASLFVQGHILNQYQHIPFNYLIINTLIIYFGVSCVFGLFIAVFDYKGLNFTQRFIRATIVLLASILSIISILITLVGLFSLI